MKIFILALLFVAWFSYGECNPVQCTGSSCRCVAPDGTTLTEEFAASANSDCACAIAKYEYEQQGLLGKTITCTATGSYDPIQCTGSECYCVNAGGQQVGDGVHIGSIGSLNC